MGRNHGYAFIVGTAFCGLTAWRCTAEVGSIAAKVLALAPQNLYYGVRILSRRTSRHNHDKALIVVTISFHTQRDREFMVGCQ